MARELLFVAGSKGAAHLSFVVAVVFIEIVLLAMCYLW
jgi:hypothetical protein